MESVTREVPPPLVTVVTVLKDDPVGFSQTLQSLESQSSQSFQWVIVDSSSDRSSTPNLLKNSRLKPDYSWVKANGIYPAMNQGADLAKGLYLYFLNAGDTLFDSETLIQVSSALQEGDFSWAFGGVEFRDQLGRILREPIWQYHEEKKHRFARGRFPAHQGVFVRHDLFDQLGGFDISYKIAADYHLITRLSCIQDPLILKFNVAKFTQGGASTTSWRFAQSEFRRARSESYTRNLESIIDELFYGTKAYASHLVVSLRTKSQ